MKDLKNLIQGCMIRDRTSQKMLYRLFYSFTMGICIRYSASRDEAVKHMNEGFYQVYDKIELYDYSDAFDQWLKAIFIGIFIEQSRGQIRTLAALENHHISLSNSTIPANNLKHHQLIMIIQKLSQELRTFYNLYVIDGYTYEQLSAIFLITHVHSKSILSVARAQLEQIIYKSGYTSL